PQLLGAPDLGKRLVNTRILTVVPERLMLVDLHHAAGPQRVAVPVLRVIRVHPQDLPDRGDRRVQVLLRHRVGDNDVTVFRKESVIGQAQNGHQFSSSISDARGQWSALSVSRPLLSYTIRRSGSCQ